MTIATHQAALPVGYCARRPRVDNAPDIYRLIAACDTAVLGAPDLTEQDVRDQLAEPGYHPATDGLLIVDDAGGAAAYGCAIGRGRSGSVDLDTFVHPDADRSLATYLLARVEGRAREIGAELGHAEVTVHHGVYRPAVADAQRLAASGYTLATTFSRLSVALHEAEPPPVPTGVTVEVCGTDDTLRRAAHAVKNEAFVDHFNAVALPYEEWLAMHDSHAVTDWSQLWLASAEGTPAGMLLATNAFVDTDNAGFVFTLAVVPAARGRGLARLLLRTAFADMRRRGRTSTLLGVDTNNTTGALALYESLGMRPILQSDMWRKVLSC